MRTARAAAGSFLFLALAPGVVAGLGPWLLTGWRVEGAALPIRIAGLILLVVGVGALLHAFARFLVEGLGTPAPVAPTERLVVGGLYRYVRNPMYLAVARDHRRAGAAPRPVDSPRLRGRVPGRGRRVRALVRGADAAPAVR
jgi:hypothetical protein